MKLGIGTYAYAWTIGVPGYMPAQPMDAFAFVQRAAERGATLVQIADNIPLHMLAPDQLTALCEQTRRLGLAVEVGTRGIQHAHLRQYIEIARQFESPILRVVVDTRDHHPEPAEIIDLIRALLPEFETAGITLALENHDRFRVQTLADILNALASPRVGICLDTVNSFGALEGPAIVVETLGRFVVNLHIKDFTIHRLDHNMGFALEGTPAGAGMLDVPWLLRRLRGDFGRHFNAILELWPAPETAIEATLAKEDAWVVESLAYLTPLFEG